MTRRALFLPVALRAAGLKVILYPGWETRGRDFTNLTHVIWHHDASPVGDSAGVPRYMLGQWAKGSAAAQVWIDRYGVWHVLGAGVAFHAGAVQPGMPGNYQALGIETDHTTGETMTDAMRVSLRHGTAAIFKALGRDASSLEFHKTVCRPHGRKSDPYGLDLATERRAVAAVNLTAFNLGDRMLALGMRGTDVEDLQRVLKIDADGIFGPATDAAVRWVQDQHGLTVDGVVGPNTLVALIGPKPAPVIVPPSAPVPPVSTEPLGEMAWPVVKYGDVSNHVKTVQGLLMSHGRALPLSGRFDMPMLAALHAHQRDWRITPSLVVDERTWRTLLRVPV